MRQDSAHAKTGALRAADALEARLAVHQAADGTYTI
jgi:hypothetical protein